ncbi:hypothetical protein ACHAXR_011922 [Thalassiosira sp. AJA248-18]
MKPLSILFRLPAASARRGITTASTTPHQWSRGLRKKSTATKKDSLHIPVMRDEVLELWLPEQQPMHPTTSGGSSGDNSRSIHLVDGTLGLGGHTLGALNSNHAENVRVLGIDRDDSTLAKAKRRIKLENVDASRMEFHHGSFSDISSNLLSRYSFPQKVGGILMDLGMNSHQIENASRGFTFRKHGPLDMRFNTVSGKGGNSSKPIKASDVINTWSASEIASVFKEFADEPYADEIATSIVQWRNSEAKRGGIRSTLELRYVIEEAVESETTRKETKKDENKFQKFRSIWRSQSKRPYSKAKMSKLLQKYEQHKLRHANHVMRCFQALRIQVNNELEHIHSIFQQKIASQCLDIGGRLVCIAFHPGEDQVVKEGMDSLVATREFKLLTHEEEGLRPSEEEVKANGRSRTARVRAVERIR